MSLTPILYMSTDTSAPALTGQVGSLATLLQAVLVDGYGSKAPAGWSCPFTATNKRVLRNSPITGTGMHLRIDDTSTVGGTNARYALTRVYETMSDIDTGTGPSPTVAQSATGRLFLKSLTLNSTSRAWMILATEKWFYLMVDVGNTATGWVGVPSWPGFAGDLVSRLPGDAYHFFLQGSSLTNYTAQQQDRGFKPQGVWSAGSWTNSGGNLVRPYTQTLGSVGGGFSSGSDGVTPEVLGNNGTFPDPISGGLLYERLMVVEGVRQIRGYMPNVYVPMHDKPFPHGVVVPDIQGLPTGTDILPWLINGYANAIATNTYQGQLLFDITNPG